MQQPANRLTPPSTPLGPKSAPFDEKELIKGLTYPHGIVRANDGSFFVADQNCNRVIKLIIQSDGTVKMENFAGKNRGYHDGKKDEASFDFVGSLAFDEKENLYVCDTDNNCVRKISSDGDVSTFIKQFVDDKNQTVTIHRCRSMTTDRKRKFLFLTDHALVLYKFDFNSGKCVDSFVLETSATLPRGLAIDAEENIYYTSSNDVFKRDMKFENKEHLATVENPKSLALSPDDRFLYIGANKTIYRFNMKTKVLQTVTEASWACGMAFDLVGNLYVCHYTWGSVKKIILRYSLPWNEQKLLWIGKLKNDSIQCPVARLPKDIVKEIIRFCDTCH